MTYLEPERLALQLQELLERRAALRAVLEKALGQALTHAEQEDIRQTLAHINKEMALVQMRLEVLRSRPQ